MRGLLPGAEARGDPDPPEALRTRIRQRLWAAVSRRRRSAPARLLAGLADAYLSAFHNERMNDFRLNGELNAIREVHADHIRASDGPFVVLDVGANAGQWSGAVRRLLPEAEIHAFEIVPETAERLARRFAGDGRVVVNRCGLLDEEGTLPVHHYPASSTGSTLYDFPWQGDSVRVEAPVRSGDAYLREAGIERVAYLKMDAEGAEGRILDGLREHFEAGRVDAVQFEYTRINILSRFLLADFYRFFERYDFAVGRIFPNHVGFKPYDIWRDETFRHGDFLALPRRRAELLRRLS